MGGPEGSELFSERERPGVWCPWLLTVSRNLRTVWEEHTMTSRVCYSAWTTRSASTLPLPTSPLPIPYRRLAAGSSRLHTTISNKTDVRRPPCLCRGASHLSIHGGRVNRRVASPDYAAPSEDNLAPVVPFSNPSLHCALFFDLQASRRSPPLTFRRRRPPLATRFYLSNSSSLHHSNTLVLPHSHSFSTAP